MSNGSDIVITGGSVDVEFDGSIYERDPNNPKKHKNPNKKITRVTISGDVNWDSGDHSNGLRCEIKVHCK